MARFINDIDTMHNMAILLERYDRDERLMLTKQVNVFLEASEYERERIEYGHTSKRYRKWILTVALNSLPEVCKSNLLHESDIERITGLFLILRRSCITFDPSDVRTLLIEKLGWPTKTASQVRKIAKKINEGVWPRPRGCYHRWDGDSLTRWLRGADEECS